MEQGHHSSDVLDYSGEAGKGFIIGDDPSGHIMGPSACAPIISTAFDLPIDLCAFPHKLEYGFLNVPLSSSKLLHPHVRWGPSLPFGFATEVAHQGSLLRGDAFDVPLGGAHHETFPGGMMAPLVGVRARV